MRYSILAIYVRIYITHVDDIVILFIQ